MPNNKRNVRPETRARVLACARELGYRPSVVAGGVRTTSTRTIGVLVPTIVNPVYPTVVHHIEKAARTDGYQVMLCSYGAHVVTRDVDLLSDLYDRMVDGIIVCGIPPIPKEPEVDKVRETMANFVRRGTPFIFLSDGEQLAHFLGCMRIDPPGIHRLFHLLTVDRALAAYNAVAHLTRLGHRRIAMVTEDTRDVYPHNVPYLRKLEGYRRALEESGLPFEPGLVVAAPGDAIGGEQCLEHLLEQGNPPSAVFCTGNFMALGVLRGARRRGLAVPSELAAYWNPSLSTVGMPIPSVAREAFRRLAILMKGGEVLPNSMVFDTEIVIRESCP